MSVSEANGASKLFPNAGERSKVQVGIGIDGGATYGLVIGGSWELPLGKIPAAAPTEPGELSGTLTIDRQGAQIDYQPGNDITSFAKLTWTVEVMP